MLDFEHFHTINASASTIPDFEEHNEDGPYVITHDIHITEFAFKALLCLCVDYMIVKMEDGGAFSEGRRSLERRRPSSTA